METFPSFFQVFNLGEALISLPVVLKGRVDSEYAALVC